MARQRARINRYASLLEQLPSTTVVVFDHDLRIEEIRGSEARGVERGSLLGRRIDEVVPPDAAAVLIANYRAALAGEERSFEFRSPANERLLWIRAAPRIEDGQIVGGMAITQDISEQRRAERQGAAEADRRQLILEAMNEAYVATDESGTVTGWNRAAEQTFGYTAEEAIGQSVAELIIPPSEHADLRALLERRLPGQPAGGRFDLRVERGAVHRDGQPLHGRAGRHPDRDRRGDDPAVADARHQRP